MRSHCDRRRSSSGSRRRDTILVQAACSLQYDRNAASNTIVMQPAIRPSQVTALVVAKEFVHKCDIARLTTFGQ